MKKVFVTGADGLLGNNLVRLLLSRAYSVKVFIQTGKTPGYLSGLPIDLSYGDILNPLEVSNAMRGCEVVIHAAALTNTWPTRGELYYKVNVEGTRHVIEAAKAHKVSKLIHIGTANSFGAGTREQPGTEKNPFTAGKFRLDYITSKYEAHQLIMQEVINNQLPALVLNPTFMIGPFDTKPSTGKMIISIATGKVPAFTIGGRNFVFVKDVATAIVNAIEKGRIGEAYILGHENLTYKDIFSKIARLAQVKAPGILMPPFLILFFGRILGAMGRLFGFEPGISYPLAAISNEVHYYDCKKAINELGLPQTPIEEAIKEALSWFEKEGYLAR